MTAVASAAGDTRRLNHVEFVHPPGDRDLVLALFSLIGIDTIQMKNGEILMGVVDSSTFDITSNDNYLAGREVRPEQWAFDQALAEALRQEPLASDFEKHKAFLAQRPYWGMHFGINFDPVEAWEAAVARVGDLEKHAPELRGRVRLLAVYRPGDPATPSPAHQAFIWTDVIASGSLALGQRIELSALVCPPGLTFDYSPAQRTAELEASLLQ